jgi:hypothetical protein
MQKKNVSLRRATVASRVLVRQLPKIGLRISEKEAKELAARMQGFANWAEMRATIGRQRPDLFDPFLTPQLQETHARQTAVLVEWGVRSDVAEQIARDFGTASNGRRVRRRVAAPHS